MPSSSKPVLFSLLVLSLLAAGTVVAQEVIVYDPDPPANGNTPVIGVTPDDRNQPLWVIPVVTRDTPFDPLNNRLPAATLAQLQQAVASVSQFWSENSYGRVSFTGRVEPRFYQLPRERSYYFNPSYVAPMIVGTQIRGPNVTVPAGSLNLELHTSATTPIKIDFDGSTMTLAELQNKVCNSLGVGDMVQCQLVNDGGNLRHFVLTVSPKYTDVGTYIHVLNESTAVEIADALGFDRPGEGLTAPNVLIDSRGAGFPATTQAGWTLTVTLANSAGNTEAFVWNVPARTYNSTGDVVSALGSLLPNASVTNSDGKLQFRVRPSIPAPFVSLRATGPADLLDSFGVARLTETDGVIGFSPRDTVRGSLNRIAGQALAALLINETSRPPDAGTDPFPNVPIDSAHEGDLNAMLDANSMAMRGIIVCILDAPPGKRAAAQGGYINAGVHNGGYDYNYQLHRRVQVIFATSTAQTLAHELGHNIGFFDLYNNATTYLPQYNYPANWDVMSAHSLFPHTGIWHKEVIAGWLAKNGSTIDAFPVPMMPGAQTEKYVVTPLEFGVGEYDSGLPAVAGRKRVKGIRLPLGIGPASEHHYLTVDNRQAGTMFSQNLPRRMGAAANGGIYIADAISPRVWMDNLFEPTTRNVVHPLTDVPLVGGDVSPVLDAAPNDDINLLNTFPAYDGVRVDVVGQVNGPGALSARPSYLVDVTREQKDFIDLVITPWGAPPFESPDIWVERNDGSLSPVPLPDNGEEARWSPTYSEAANGGRPLNFVRVQVTNAGSVTATGCKVRLKINQPAGMGDKGTWVALPESAPQDIPAGQSRIFDFPWTPRVNEHTCIQAETYATGPFGDWDPYNNRTQENFENFCSRSASPWSPLPFAFDIGNNRPEPVDVYVEPLELPRGFRVGLSKNFLTVPPKSKVQVAGLVTIDDRTIPTPSPNETPVFVYYRFHLAGYLRGGDYQLPIGGITYQAGLAREVKADVRVSSQDGLAVVEVSTAPVAPSNKVDIMACFVSGRCEWVPTTTDAAGRARQAIPRLEPGTVRVSVYLPPNYSPPYLLDLTVTP